MNSTIYNMDCIQLMKSMQEDGTFVDVILTSPPYNTSRKGSSLTNACENIRYDEYNDCKSNDEYVAWTADVFSMFDKVLAKDGVVLYNLSYSSENTECMWLAVSEIIKNTPFTVADCIVWKKKSATPNNMSPNKLTRICEFVFVFCRKSEFATFHCNKKVTSTRRTGQHNHENIYNFIEAANNDGCNSIHKATYSTELVYKLLSIYGKPGGVILDPFIGTGTSALGSINFGMDCIGSEISSRYVDIAKKRILEKNQQLTLF